MSLYVRYDTVREPAAKPAAQERCTITDAVRKAVQDELDRHAFEHDERWRVLREIQAEIAKLPELAPRSLTDKDLYDEDGLPML